MIITKTFCPSRIDCPSIPATMKGVIVSLKGVKDAKVHYEERSVDVTFDDAETSDNAIIQAVGKEMGLALKVAMPGDEAAGSVIETYPM